MKLVIFPGGGSPGNPKYASAYGLLQQAALKHGYDSVDAPLLWPGHENQGVLTLDGALDRAFQKVAELDKDSQQYDFLARSFGCYVAVKVALERCPTRLRKVILWGPPPYWLMWEMWHRDLDANRLIAAEKGLAVDQTLFPSLDPLECMLPLMRHETVVATGEQDPYVSPACLRYLQSVVQERRSTKFSQSIKFREAVPGAVHEVTQDAPEPVIRAYLTALFD